MRSLARCISVITCSRDMRPSHSIADVMPLADFTECADCHVALLAGPVPPEPPDPFDPALDLVEVLETEDSVQLAMAKGLLEDAGIPFFLLGQIASLVNDVDPFLQKHVRVQVPRDREAEAREILDPVLHPENAPPLTDGDAGVTPRGGC